MVAARDFRIGNTRIIINPERIMEDPQRALDRIAQITRSQLTDAEKRGYGRTDQKHACSDSYYSRYRIYGDRCG